MISGAFLSVKKCRHVSKLSKTSPVFHPGVESVLLFFLDELVYPGVFLVFG